MTKDHAITLNDRIESFFEIQQGRLEEMEKTKSNLQSDKVDELGVNQFTIFREIKC